MNKEEIINNSIKYYYIYDNKKYGEFISINDEKYHLCCIEQLQLENKELKEKIDKIQELLDNRYNYHCETCLLLAIQDVIDGGEEEE